ncbi:MAG: nitrate reductase molybdenum cofactor assembly chaperone [Fervidicoccaceae archaeon]
MKQEFEDSFRFFEVVGKLLEYPDTAFFESIHEAEKAIGKFPSRTTILEKIVLFRKEISALDLYQLQELYSKTFDFSADSTLNISYYFSGDSNDRGRVLAYFSSFYRKAGEDPPKDDLPDSVPHLLKLISQHPELFQEIVALLAVSLRKIAEALKENPYRNVIEAIEIAIEDLAFNWKKCA